MRRATHRECRSALSYLHFYPRSPCGERPDYFAGRNYISQISIHALLAESDHRECRSALSYLHFYPRSPCGERLGARRRHTHNLTFLSTLSLRRATRSSCKGISYFIFLSTLSLRRATISVHIGSPFYQIFLSTLSLRRATILSYEKATEKNISIHALLAESDMDYIPWLPLFLHFYPRSPCGERRSEQYQLIKSADYFYPRSPCGERR